MHFTAFVQVSPVSRAPRPALRALLRAARRIRRLPGFSRWQTFRTMDASDALLIVTDWDSAASMESAIRSSGLKELAEELAECGMLLSPAESLHGSFDRTLTTQPGVASLLRLSRGEATVVRAAHDADLSLQALAAPGSIRLQGAAAPDGAAVLCRIDFDTEDGIWHFLQSPLRKQWSCRAEVGLEAETWAINLPRLEYGQPGSLHPSRKRPRETRDTLCVEYSIDEAQRSAWIRLYGRIDARGSARCERLCELILHTGCRRLEVDVSDLTRISPDALGMLARTARGLKERGGQFVLTDNEERVKRVTRSRHLATSVR